MPCSVFFALLQRHKHRTDLENYRSGLIATIISSLFAKEGDDVTKPAEWFEPKEPEQMKMSDDLIVEKIKLYAMIQKVTKEAKEGRAE